jgi:hypothetical protein
VITLVWISGITALACQAIAVLISLVRLRQVLKVKKSNAKGG